MTWCQRCHALAWVDDAIYTREDVIIYCAKTTCYRLADVRGSCGGTLRLTPEELDDQVEAARRLGGLAAVSSILFAWMERQREDSAKQGLHKP